MDNKVLYVLLPCYNEEENLRLLLNQWKLETDKNKDIIKIKIIIINDGSEDNTLRVINYLKIFNNNFTVISHTYNQGLGEALNTGLNYILKQDDLKYICVMDSDMSHSPIYINKMLEKIKDENFNCIIASRYMKGSKVEGVSFFRRILSYSAKVIYKITFKIPQIKDYTCGFRLYDDIILKKLKYKYKNQIINEKGFACTAELLYKVHREKGKIGEIPFSLRYQCKKGKSKMKIIQTITRSIVITNKLMKN